MRRTWVVLTIVVLAVAVLVTGLDAAQKKPQSLDVKADQIEKVKAALPAAPTVKPKKARKLLIFSLCKGFVHGSIPIGAKAIELMGAKTGAYTSVSTLDPEVFLGDVHHQTLISVDENGTYAIASTAADMVGPDVPTVRLNRPFIFLLRDIETGTVLFIGQVLDPSAGMIGR